MPIRSYYKAGCWEWRGGGDLKARPVDHLVCDQDPDSVTSSLSQWLVATTLLFCQTTIPVVKKRKTFLPHHSMPFKIYWVVPEGAKQIRLFRPFFLHLEFLWNRTMAKMDSNRPSDHHSWGAGIETYWETQKPPLISFFLPMEPWFFFFFMSSEKRSFPAPRENPEESKVKLYANNRNHLSFATI